MRKILIITFEFSIILGMAAIFGLFSRNGSISISSNHFSTVTPLFNNGILLNNGNLTRSEQSIIITPTNISTPIPQVINTKSKSTPENQLPWSNSLGNAYKSENYFCDGLSCFLKYNDNSPISLQHEINDFQNSIGTSTPSPTQRLMPSETPTYVYNFQNLELNQVLELGNSKPNLEVFIRVPSSLVPQPYVILSGYQSLSGDFGNISLSGTFSDKKFVCNVTPCALEISGTGQINFRAFNQNGDTSDPLQANVVVSKLVDGYSVSIISLSKFVNFSDSCANAWQVDTSESPYWARFPQDPAFLETDKDLYYLAGKLIQANPVFVSDCPNGGLDFNDSPNACGLNSIRNEMARWQNQFNMNIWIVGRNEQIPPILLKVLMEIESQFWPTSQRRYLDELGLGQINQLGIDVLLRTNPALYQKVCSSSLFSCNKPYLSLSGIEQQLIRGTLAQSLNANCPTCKNGLNVNKAAMSIPLIAQVLNANCVQAKSILQTHKITSTYEDIWKYSLISYHSGYGCLKDAVDLTDKENKDITWETVSPNISCPGAVEYVDKFWIALVGFDYYQKFPEGLPLIKVLNPTQVPAPTVVYSEARIIVKVFLDKNGDGIQQTDESLDNVQVNLDLENGVAMSKYTRNGLAIFDLGDVSVGVKGIISLPGLYRNASILVQNRGDTPIIFIFSSPILPTKIP